MALQVEDHGRDNWVEVGAAERARLHGRIVFLGDGARVTIGAGCVDTGLRIEAGAGAAVSIGPGGHLGALFVHAGAGASVSLGAGAGVNGLVRLLAHEPARIAIGADCLLAAEAEIAASDMHPIFDAATGARINPAADVTLGDRVWVGQRAMLLKGVRVGDDSVIGAGAVVTRPVPPGCVAAGNPARVVRRGVRWSHTLV
jgi:acetyltransferase-like isoleucine patch superfamily enzyme